MRRAVTGAFATLFGTVSSLMLGVVFPFVALRGWSGEMYGQWVTALASVSIFVCIDYAHQLYVGNRYTNLFNEETSEDARRELLEGGLAFSLVIGLGKIFLFCILLVVDAGNPVLGIAFPLFLANALFSGPLGIVVQLYRPHGEYARGVFLSTLTLMGGTLGAAAAIVMFDLGVGPAVLVFAGLKALFETSLFVYTIKRYCLGSLLTGPGRILFGWHNYKKSFGHLLNAGLEAAVLQGSIVVLERGVGGAGAAYYATCRTLANLLLQNIGIVLFPVTHDYTRFLADRDYLRFRTLWWVTGFILALGTTLMVGTVVGFAKPVFEFWTHGKFGSPDLVLTLLVCSAVLRIGFIPIYVIFQQLNHARILGVGSFIRLLVFVMAVIFCGPSPLVFAASAATAEAAVWGYLVFQWLRYCKGAHMPHQLSALAPLWSCCGIFPFLLCSAPWGLGAALTVFGVGIVGILLALKALDSEAKSLIEKRLLELKQRVF